jgi:hypothetical protein
MEGAKGLHDRDSIPIILTAFWVTVFTFQVFRRNKFHKERGFLDWLRKYYFPNKRSALWSQITVEETHRVHLQTATGKYSLFFSANQTRYTPACTLCPSTVRGKAKTEYKNRTVSYLVQRRACVFLLTKFIWLFMTTALHIFTHFLTSVRV